MITIEKIIDGKSFTSKKQVFETIANQLKIVNNQIDEKAVIEKLNEREQICSTQLQDDIAIPHAAIPNLETSKVYIVQNLNLPWDHNAKINAGLVICILTPENASATHLEIISTFARKLTNLEFLNLLKSGTKAQIEAKANQDEVNLSNANQEASLKIVAVTGCPTGIAHTYMAAEKIMEYCQLKGYKCKVETRGQGGVQNELTMQEIQEADFVLISADVEVELSRFNFKKGLKTSVKEPIKNIDKLFEQMLNHPETFENQVVKTEKNQKPSIYNALMNGVTHMLPFTIAGGILIALRFLFGTTDDIANNVKPLIENVALGTLFGDIGGILFQMMIPILAGYIAFAIGNRAAIMPGFLAGGIASSTGSGFLGAIFGAIIAGYAAKIMFEQMNKLNKSIQGIYQILIIPLILAIFVGTTMYLLAIPMEKLNTGLTNFLRGLEQQQPILLGLIIGVMMASDMGGPINKAAYVTGTLLLSEGNQTFMAAVMAGGMTPPLVIAIATQLNKQKWTCEERDAAKSNWILGLSFITEGAIPFAAANPKVIIPSIICGSAISSALTMMFKITLPAPHGGLFVFPLVNNPFIYLIAILIGSISGAIILNYFKKEVV